MIVGRTMADGNVLPIFWAKADVAQNTSATLLVREPLIGSGLTKWYAPARCYVVGLEAHLNADTTVSTLTVVLKKNGAALSGEAATVFSAVLNTTDVNRKFVAPTRKDVLVLAEGDYLEATFATGATYEPTGTADLLVTAYVGVDKVVG